MASSTYSWSSGEDQVLIELVQENGDKKWSKIAKLFNQRFSDSDKTGKQCRERWHNHLDPALNLDSFTLEDEIKVFEYQRQYGNKWSLIATHFEGKNDNFIKNCFYSAIRRNIRKYNKDKVRSKQLKGTINSLLKKKETRELLMDFPEHNVPPAPMAKVETTKSKPNEVVSPTVVQGLVHNLFNRRQPPTFFNTYIWQNSWTAELKRIDDINPYNPRYSIEVTNDDSETFHEAMSFALLSPRISDPLTDSSTKSGVKLPDYILQDKFQHYTTPRNSK